MSKRHIFLNGLLIIVVLIVQLIIWQATLVQMAHVHSEMGYPTAVHLLDNKPLSFYGLVTIPLLLANVILVLGWVCVRKPKRTPNEQEQVT